MRKRRWLPHRLSKSHNGVLHGRNNHVTVWLQCFHSFNPWKRPHDFYFCFVKDKDKETMMNAPRMFITFDSKWRRRLWKSSHFRDELLIAMNKEPALGGQTISSQSSILCQFKTRVHVLNKRRCCTLAGSFSKSSISPLLTNTQSSKVRDPVSFL